MGVASYIIGYIEEAWPGARTDGIPGQREKLIEAKKAIEVHNETILSQLPLEDDFPPLVREMFSWAPLSQPMITYKNRLIHFAASMKDFDCEARGWLDKFENLLKNLYWESAFVRIEMPYIGKEEFTWEPSRAWVEKLCQGNLEFIDEWTFSSTLPPEDLDALRYVE